MTHNETNISESGPLWPDITELFQGPEDRAWAADRDRLVHDVVTRGAGVMASPTPPATGEYRSE